MQLNLRHKAKAYQRTPCANFVLFCFLERPCHKLTRNIQAEILHQEKDRFN